MFLAVVSFTVPLAAPLEVWHSWIKRYKKVYSSEREEARRKQIWLGNVLNISEHNSKNLTFVIQLNQFADLVSIFSKS